uniref:Uncharacterized protein n=1 Tax=Sphaerodactylus townsendi TaxID=933632 RepID=A0ACB8FS86_9SAUR
MGNLFLFTGIKTVPFLDECHGVKIDRSVEKLLSNSSLSFWNILGKPTELQPYSLECMQVPSSQSSVVVPTMRLGVLLFLLNKRCQRSTVPVPMSLQGGQRVSLCLPPWPSCSACPKLLWLPFLPHPFASPAGLTPTWRVTAAMLGLGQESQGRDTAGMSAGSFRSEGSWPAAQRGVENVPAPT